MVRDVGYCCEVVVVVLVFLVRRAAEDYVEGLRGCEVRSEKMEGGEEGGGGGGEGEGVEGFEALGGYGYEEGEESGVGEVGVEGGVEGGGGGDAGLHC